MPSGSFHPRRTSAWKEVLEMARSNGVVPADTAIEKFRDQWYAYRKRRTKGVYLISIH